MARRSAVKRFTITGIRRHPDGSAEIEAKEVGAGDILLTISSTMTIAWLAVAVGETFIAHVIPSETSDNTFAPVWLVSTHGLAGSDVDAISERAQEVTNFVTTGL